MTYVIIFLITKEFCLTFTLISEVLARYLGRSYATSESDMSMSSDPKGSAAVSMMACSGIVKERARFLHKLTADESRFTQIKLIMDLNFNYIAII